jgi:magnesium transporter
MASELARYYVANFVEDAAKVIENLDTNAAAEFIGALDADEAAALLCHMLPAAARSCLLTFSAERAADVLRELPHAHAVRLLALVPRERQRDILSALPQDRRQMLQHALFYPEDSIGTVVIPNPPCCRNTAEVVDAKRMLTRDGLDEVPILTVVDDAHRPIGLLEFSELLRLDDSELIAEHMRPVPVRLRARADLATAVNLRAWLTEDYLPVTDAENRFIGLLAKTAVYQLLLLSNGERRGPDDAAAAVFSLAELFWRPGAELLVDATTRAGEQR